MKQEAAPVALLTDIEIRDAWNSASLPSGPLPEGMELGEVYLRHMRAVARAQLDKLAIPPKVERGEDEDVAFEMVLDVGAILIAQRRKDYLFRNTPRCPACDAEQVQCVDWMRVPSYWRCRECEHGFDYEPALASPPVEQIAEIAGRPVNVFVPMATSEKRDIALPTAAPVEGRNKGES